MTDTLLLVFIFLAAGVIAVPIASRLGLGSVLGYLIAGIALSPLLSAIDVNVTSIQHVAEFGVVMMLFLVGLELEPKLLWQMRMRLLGLGGLQVAATTAAVTGIALALDQPWTVALVIGLVFALSSTAIVLQTLNEKGLTKSDGGQASFSVLLFQDIAVIPMLALIPLLAMPELMDLVGDASHGDGGHGAEGGEAHGSGLSLVDGLNGWQTALVTLGAIAAVVVGGSYLTAPIFRFIAMARLRELFTATALMIVVGIAVLMSLVNLSPALGTFLAGVVLANSQYRHELESDIDPFRGLLLGLFFITVGANIRFDLLADNIGTVVGLTFGLIALKAAVLVVLGLVFKIRGADRWLFALGLAQAGEFGFVLLTFTVDQAVIPTDIADLLALVVAISMLLTPLLFIAHDRLISPRFTGDGEREADDIEPEGSVIIAGHGRFGGIVNRMLRAHGYETTVVDYSAAQLEMLRTFGIKVHYGDATRPDLLQAAGIDKAKLLVVAIDGQERITALVEHVFKHHPHVHVIARAVSRHHVYDLWAVGCRDVIRETYDSSLRAGRSSLEALGKSHAEAARMTREFEDMDRESMVELAELYRRDVPAHQNPAYIAKVRERSARWAQQLSGGRAVETPDDADVDTDLDRDSG